MMRKKITGKGHPWTDDRGAICFLRMLLLLFAFVFDFDFLSLAHGEERWMALAALEIRGWRQSGT